GQTKGRQTRVIDRTRRQGVGPNRAMTLRHAAASRPQESGSAMPNTLPIHESSPQPAPARPADQDFRLWRDAPAWRNLILAAIGISAALLALPMIETGTDQAQTDHVKPSHSHFRIQRGREKWLVFLTRNRRTMPCNAPRSNWVGRSIPTTYPM